MIINLPNLTSLSGERVFYGTKIRGIESLGQITTLPFTTTPGSSSRYPSFYHITTLEYANLPDTLTNIGRSFFYQCTALTTINYDWSKLVSLGQAAFSGCTALEFDELNLENLTSLGQNAFYKVKIRKMNLGALTAFPLCTNDTQNFGDKSVLEEIVLSESLETIRDYSFINYAKMRLASSVLPNVTTVGINAFCYCAAIEAIELPSVQTVANVVFRGCTSLRYVKLGASVTSIGNYQFGDAATVPNLEYIICEAITPPAIKSTTWYYSNNCPIYVPDESVEAYRTASNWSAYADRIYPMSVYEQGGGI